MARRYYTPKPHLDRLMMRRLGSALQPEYDALMKSPLPPEQRDLLLRYAVAEAVNHPSGKPSRAQEAVPRFPM